MFNLVGKRYWFFLLSLLVIIPGLISLLFPPALRPGIEFSSGSVLTVHFGAQIEQAQVREEMAALGHPDAIIQRTGAGDFIIRTRALRPEEKDDAEIIKPA